MYPYKDHLGNIRINYAWDDEANELKVLNEHHYYLFGLEHATYNPERREFKRGESNNHPIQIIPVENAGYQYKYNGKELQDELGLNMYQTDYRLYDPALGRFSCIDALADELRNETPYHYSHNNPIYFKDPTGLYPNSWESTVVNEQGVVIDHKKDGDSNIYLNNRNGPIVGQEEEGKEYKKGDRLYEVKGNIDTYFELMVEVIQTQRNIDTYNNLMSSFNKKLDEILDKIKKNIPLSESDYSYLSEAKNIKEIYNKIIEFYGFKTEEINKMLKKIKWGKTIDGAKNNTLRLLINELTGKIPYVSSLEDPRNGETISDKIKNKYTKSKIPESNKLPYTFPNYLREKNRQLQFK